MGLGFQDLGFSSCTTVSPIVLLATVTATPVAALALLSGWARVSKWKVSRGSREISEQRGRAERG